MIEKIFRKFRRFLPYKIKKGIALLRYRFFNIFSIITIETSSACNRRCSYCPNSKFDRGLIKNRKDLKTELFYKIINELVELKWFGQIQLNFYNEPLLDERLPELTKYARLKLPASSIAIYTNGDFLTIGLYKRLIEAGVTDFIITQHQQITDSIDKLLEFRNAIGNNHVKVICKKLECFSSRSGLIQLSPEEKRTKYCPWPTHNFVVNYEGETVLCCNDYLNTVKLGNIGEKKLIDIWNTPYYKQIRNDLNRGIFRHEICKGCTLGKLSS